MKILFVYGGSAVPSATFPSTNSQGRFRVFSGSAFTAGLSSTPSLPFPHFTFTSLLSSSSPLALAASPVDLQVLDPQNLNLNKKIYQIIYIYISLIFNQPFYIYGPVLQPYRFLIGLLQNLLRARANLVSVPILRRCFQSGRFLYSQVM